MKDALADNVKVASPSIVFPHFFDPRLGHTSLGLLRLAKLHLILLGSVVIQDNFLISRLLADARQQKDKRSPFCDWIERGWVKVALRQSCYSLTDLKERFRARPSYIPFEGRTKGGRLYQARWFQSYLKEIDACLPIDGAVLPWDEREMGKRLRVLMKSSAEDGSSGLPRERALSIWNEVDRTAIEKRHNRSMWYDYAKSLSDSQEAQLVCNWVGFEYLVNLPDALSLGISAPRTSLTGAGGLDPIEDIDGIKSVIDPSITRGRDTFLLNGAFLDALGTSDIERLRRLDEFKKLADARSVGKAGAIKESLLNYLRALGEEGPMIIDSRIRTLEAQVYVKRIVGTGAVCLGVAMQSLNPELCAALQISGVFLCATQGTEKRLKKVEGEVITNLEVQRTSVVDLCHGSAGRPRGTPNQPMHGT